MKNSDLTLVLNCLQISTVTYFALNYMFPYIELSQLYANLACIYFTHTFLRLSKPWLLQLFVPGTELQTASFCICIFSLALPGAS